MNASTKRTHAGFTLIELMISIVLGMVIIGAITAMYASGSLANRNAEAQRQMFEDAQMALGSIAMELRGTGYNPPRNAAGAVNGLGQVPTGWNVFACDSNFTDPSLPNLSALSCSGKGGLALATVYEGDRTTGKMTSATPSKLMDCLGNGVTASTGPIDGRDYFIMQARLYVESNALKCRGGGDLTQAQVLAENIESMSLAFAVAEPGVNGSKLVQGYVSASEINTPANVAQWSNAGGVVLPLLDRWNKTVAARVCVVAMSEDRVINNTSASGTNPTYLACDGTSQDITDGKLRRAYSTTVLLRNHNMVGT